MREWLKHPCRHCGASEGSDCVAVGSNQPLRLVPAHPTRMEAAGVQINYQAVIDKIRGVLE